MQDTTQQTQTGVHYFPLDVTKLAKGQTIGIDELERIMGIHRASSLWNFGLMKLQRQIAKLRADLGLNILTTRTHRGKLIICDDSDAANYNRSMGKRGIRRFVRSTRRNIAVDVTKLPPDEREAHERTLRRQAMMLTAIRSSRHAALPEPSKPDRVTPKMVVGPENTGDGR